MEPRVIQPRLPPALALSSEYSCATLSNLWPSFNTVTNKDFRGREMSGHVYLNLLKRLQGSRMFLAQDVANIDSRCGLQATLSLLIIAVRFHSRQATGKDDQDHL